jgi:hypothetical protein
MVPGVEEVSDGPASVDKVEELQSPPFTVTVTVADPRLMVENIVVVAHEVTVEAGHCELVVDREWLLDIDSLGDALGDPLVDPHVGADVGDSGVEGEELVSPEDVGELVAVDEDEAGCGTPHSSKLWPFATVNGTVYCRALGLLACCLRSHSTTPSHRILARRSSTHCRRRLYDASVSFPSSIMIPPRPNGSPTYGRIHFRNRSGSGRLCCSKTATGW